MDFKIFRHISFVIFLALLATNGHAEEAVLKVDVARKINFDVTIEPPVMQFSFEKKLYFHGQTMTLYVVVVPELQKQAAPACRGMACILQTQVTDKMDGQPSIPKAEAVAHFKADTQRFVKFTRRFNPDGKMVLVEKTDSGADAAARLKADGYTSWGGAKNVISDGRKYKLTEWVKAVSKTDSEPYGSVSARISIRSDADIDFEKSVFTGKFKATAPITFNFDKPPNDPVRRQRAIELFTEFRNRVTTRYMTIIDALNTKRRLLNRKDLALLRDMAPGEDHIFNKKIILDWFGERRTVNVNIAATIGIADGAADAGAQHVKYFEENEDGRSSADAENGALPRPPSGLKIETR